MNNLTEILEKKTYAASTPCRIDFAGTLDIPTFNFTMSDLCPVTFNMALNLRTKVKLLPNKKGYIKVSSKGFDEAEFEARKAPYDHPLGLIFAIADSFEVSGVHIDIDSSSPPRSALGGSSVAAVALCALFMQVLKGPDYKVMAKDAAVSAQLIESAVAGVPCGFQDHLAAAFGGINAWHWNNVVKWPQIKNTSLLRKSEASHIMDNFLVAYTGKTHHSHSVNTQWRQQYVRGEFRTHWEKITELSQMFCNSFIEKDFETLAKIVNEEVLLRREMTPEVLDEAGKILFDSALDNSCGARFTGAGGGGCIWAVGRKENIEKLRKNWEKHLSGFENGKLLNAQPDFDGILFED
ncbi:MAG: galactokinase [Thermodesulfobacteriota bacterium]